MTPSPEPEDPGRERRVALITGASGGLGTAIAAALHEDGWRLVLLGRNDRALERLAASLHMADAVIGRADVRAWASVESATTAALATTGRLDLVVAGAGVLTVGATDAAPLEEWQDTLAVNLLGAYHTIRATLPALRQAGGRYVLISSIAGRKGLPNLSAYSASKAALIALGESTAAEAEDDGVQVTSIVLGPTDTPMLDRPGASGQRLAPEHVAAVVGFLARLPGEVICREVPLRAARRRATPLAT